MIKHKSIKDLSQAHNLKVLARFTMRFKTFNGMQNCKNNYMMKKNLCLKVVRGEIIYKTKLIWCKVAPNICHNYNKTIRVNI